ncbi:hypothetical protein F3Y22_tig00111022pilonHSYRG00109 [Hibiscus syriacus]|uniref:Reverse transcriptase domain-containing protein n=1 Tax=Hibiscus syriacus TaxID=106335 RepID=A0A6A2Z6T8_HIBSY|nr:hypothetical protein F3Y22_tig00111022pilonHSYRG00109 [Hibiscus syriacus]
MVDLEMLQDWKVWKVVLEEVGERRYKKWVWSGSMSAMGKLDIDKGLGRSSVPEISVSSDIEFEEDYRSWPSIISWGVAEKYRGSFLIATVAVRKYNKDLGWFGYAKQEVKGESLAWFVFELSYFRRYFQYSKIWKWVIKVSSHGFGQSICCSVQAVDGIGRGMGYFTCYSVQTVGESGRVLAGDGSSRSSLADQLAGNGYSIVGADHCSIRLICWNYGGKLDVFGELFTTYRFYMSFILGRYLKRLFEIGKMWKMRKSHRMELSQVEKRKSRMRDKCWRGERGRDEESEDISPLRLTTEDDALEMDKWIVARIIGFKKVESEEVLRVFRSIWGHAILSESSILKDNMFLFKFKTLSDKLAIMKRTPWSFEGMLLAIVHFDPTLSLEEFDFRPLAVWVRIYELPLEYMKIETAEKIGNRIGKTIATDTRPGDGRMGDFLRVRVEIDISKPLRICVKMGMFANGDPRKCLLKYERLPSFCHKVSPIKRPEESSSRRKKGIIYVEGENNGRSLTSSTNSPISDRGTRTPRGRPWMPRRDLLLSTSTNQDDSDPSDPSGPDSSLPRTFPEVFVGCNRDLIEDQQANRELSVRVKVGSSSSGKRKIGETSKGKRKVKRVNRKVVHISDSTLNSKVAPPGAMTIFYWNCRGLGNPTTIRELRRLISEKDSMLVFVSETKLRKNKTEAIRVATKMGGCFEVERSDRCVGLMMLWREEFDVTLQSFSNIHIDVETGWFTWASGTRARTFVCDRIDRFVAKNDWRFLFPEARVNTVPMASSDHSAIVMSLEGVAVTRSARRDYFKFNVCWANEDKCRDIVHRVWENVEDSFEVKVGKSRVAWLKDGDRNSSFFHARANGRRKKNWIEGLENEGGVWCDRLEDIFGIASSYFSSLFRYSAANPDEEILQAIEQCIEPCDNDMLCREFSTDEVTTAFSQVNPSKAPGFDGLPDMEKAYDRVEWDFLLNVMTRLGFCNPFVNLIRKCISTVSFQVRINGVLSDAFVPQRGLRQGDPLSPYLFLFCAQGLSALLLKAQRRNEIKGIRASLRGPRVTHLFYADDSLLFVKNSVAEVRRVKSILAQYEKASGQKVNYEKSSIFFSPNTPSVNRGSFLSELGVVEAPEPGNYLGLPLVVGKGKRAAFNFIKDRTERRIQGWTKRLLSFGGREVFIKSVVQALPACAMTCYLLPEGVIEDIKSQARSYWWSGKHNSRGWAMVAWDKICQPKKFGGMGFRDLRLFNVALLGNQIWRFIQDEQSLAFKVLKAKYFPSSSFFKAKLGANFSYAWASLMKAKEELKDGFFWRVGINSEAHMFDDNWGDASPFKWRERYMDNADQPVRVADFMIPGCARLDEPKVLGVLRTEDAAQVLKTLISPIRGDRMLWGHHCSGFYSAKSGYNWLNLRNSPTLVAVVIWNGVARARVLPNIRIFGWRICHEAIPVGAKLLQANLGNGVCPLCNRELESILHAIKDCPKVKSVLVLSGLSPVIVDWSGNSPLSWLAFAHSKLINEVPEFDGEFNSVSKACGASRDDEVIRRQRVWLKSVQDKVKINMDGAFCKDSRVAAIGVVARDSYGMVIGGLAKKIEPPFSAESSEAAAFTKGIRLASENGWNKVVIEGDAISIVHRLANQVTGKIQDFSTIGLLLNEARQMLVRFPTIKVHYVCREANRVAHSLAHLALSNNNPVWFYFDKPDCIKQVVIDDAIGI